MYSESDSEKLWFIYKTQGEPKGVSINKFCMINNLSTSDSGSHRKK